LRFAVFSLLLAGVLGRDFFPKVDAGRSVCTCVLATGLRIEETARLADQVNGVIREPFEGRTDHGSRQHRLALQRNKSTYSNAGTIGTSDAEILVQLKEVRGKPTSMYINDLRQKLPSVFPGVQFFFQPADIVTQILNFGTPAPIVWK